ncbi:hypothetical protein KEU06_15625 [Pseudaminobacter sp. 19-2017]|uniref:Uncharacterized protein n=1 Tax=Pseudaminobacter soli (ex Zhang et al. 2022) TaxID=2831468 RepID=A0A942DYN4_9HYPH|nr:hypothetical protein [Pseudaminobacter soli]MBS3650041.1 hypothetical protein [Pseudaminobacter soli]
MIDLFDDPAVAGAISWREGSALEGEPLELLLNGINGTYLRSILLNAEKRTHRVDAAVAYATENDLLFDWCWDQKLPLRFWGRFDESVPVAIPVLKKFLDKRSGRYVCKLVRNFHPKVIWWRGYGAYIGSAKAMSMVRRLPGIAR